MLGHLAHVPRSAPARPAAAVRLAHVTRLFDGLAAISQVNLAVEAGETVWLRGSNGSGKTTLLRVIGTAISPTFGRGTVLGQDLVRGRAAIRAETELLGHQTRIYEDLTAAENLRFASALYGVERQRCDARAVTAALERVGLHEVGAVHVGRFSHGMRQRLALARCLIRAPRLLLLDEPYAGLDVDARAVVDDLLAGARRAGQTVVLASHEAPPGHLVDRSLRMDAGRLASAAQRPP
ncbi:MAG TPA: ABC transporter ATP-binding protein [Jatrophihabitans sp.]|nr:ABC transporter ATP-binding protein [Jatrophihabitans sp.]